MIIICSEADSTALFRLRSRRCAACNIRSDGMLILQRADSAVDGDGGYDSATALVRRTAELAAEVAGLARQLDDRQKRLQKNQVC